MKINANSVSPFIKKHIIMKKNIKVEIADAIEQRQGVTAAFGLFAELVERAGFSSSGSDYCSPAGAELLYMFQREFERVDQRLEDLLETIA